MLIINKKYPESFSMDLTRKQLRITRQWEPMGINFNRVCSYHEYKSIIHENF